MITFRIAVFIASLLVTASELLAGITIGPVRGQPGESIRLVTFSETKGGTIESKGLHKPTTGSMEITRERDLIWTFRTPAADGTRRGMVRVPKLITTTRSVIQGKEEKITDQSPLVGKMFAMSKSPGGDWNFELDGSLTLARVRSEIEELKVYLKRDWYPNRVINVGDSWEFDPAWIRMVIERDLSKAQTIGTMRLRQIRNTEKRRIAVIDVSIRSTGAEFRSDGSESDASILLSGEVLVNLETMLDEALELKGTITSKYIKGAETTTMKLPIRMIATKSFIKDAPAPPF